MVVGCQKVVKINENVKSELGKNEERHAVYPALDAGPE